MNTKEKNVQFIQRSKEELKAMGIEISTTQLYEFYSKLILKTNWNVAKSKNIDFQEKIIYENQSCENLVSHIQNLNSDLVLQQIFQRQGFSMNMMDSSINRYGVSGIVSWSDNKKIMVMYVDRIVGSKKISLLAKAMDEFSCSHGVILTLATDLPAALYKMAMEHGIELVDQEDLFRLSKRIDLGLGW